MTIASRAVAMIRLLRQRRNLAKNVALSRIVICLYSSERTTLLKFNFARTVFCLTHVSQHYKYLSEFYSITSITIGFIAPKDVGKELD